MQALERRRLHFLATSHRIVAYRAPDAAQVSGCLTICAASSRPTGRLTSRQQATARRGGRPNVSSCSSCLGTRLCERRVQFQREMIVILRSAFPRTAGRWSFKAAKGAKRQFAAGHSPAREPDLLLYPAGGEHRQVAHQAQSILEFGTGAVDKIVDCLWEVIEEASNSI